MSRSYSRFLLALSVAALWFTPAGAVAQTAAGACDAYADSITPAEAKSYADSLRLPLPAEYAKLLLNIRIENGDPAGNIAPFASAADGSSPKIVVPRGFRRLNCRVVVAAVAYMNHEIVISDSDQRRFRECVAGGGGRYVCFSHFIDAIIPTATEMPDRSWTSEQKEQWTKYVQQLKQWADLSFRFILQHEAGHLVSMLGKDSALLQGLDAETAADLQATLALSPRQYHSSTIVPAAAVFGLWSVVDSTIDWSQEPHPPFACRAHMVLDIYRRIVPKIDAIRAWSYEEERNAPIEVKPVGNVLPFIDDAGVHCPTGNDGRLRLVSDDLDRLVEVFRQTQNLPQNSMVEEVRMLLTAPLKTDEVRGLIAEAVANWVPSVIRNAVGDGDVFDHPYTQEEKRGARLLRTIATNSMNLVEREVDRRLVSSEVFGETAIELEQLRMALNHTHDTQLLRSEIDFLKIYSPGSATIPAIEMQLALDRGDCKRVREMAKEAIRIDPSRDTDLSTFTEIGDRECGYLSRALQ